MLGELIMETGETHTAGSLGETQTTLEIMQEVIQRLETIEDNLRRVTKEISTVKRLAYEIRRKPLE